MRESRRETEPGESGPPDPEHDCRNCGAPLQGPYCHECGQRVDDRLVPVQQLVAQAVEDVLQLDVRLVRTLRALLRPGVLTVAYLAGRREQYVPPLRLLLISGFVLLLALGLGQRLRSDGAGIVIQLDDDAEAALVQRRDSLEGAGSLRARLEAYAVDSALRGHREPEQLNRLFVERLSLLALLLIPFAALILRGLYRDRLYVEHLIATLHLHAVLFGVLGLGILLALGARLLGMPPNGAAVVLGVVALPMPPYVWGTLRRVYRDGPAVTTLKLAALGLGYGVAFVSALTLYATFTILRV
jgi:hypothetical protein